MEDLPIVLVEPLKLSSSLYTDKKLSKCNEDLTESGANILNNVLENGDQKSKCPSRTELENSKMKSASLKASDELLEPSQSSKGSEPINETKAENVSPEEANSAAASFESKEDKNFTDNKDSTSRQKPKRNFTGNIKTSDSDISRSRSLTPEPNTSENGEEKAAKLNLRRSSGRWSLRKSVDGCENAIPLRRKSRRGSSGEKANEGSGLLAPFEYGFKRELVLRATSEGPLSDVYYIDSKGQKLRSKPEVSAYLKKKKDVPLSVENFCFLKKAIHKEPYDVTRQAKSRRRSKVGDSNDLETENKDSAAVEDNKKEPSSTEIKTKPSKIKKKADSPKNLDSKLIVKSKSRNYVTLKKSTAATFKPLLKKKRKIWTMPSVGRPSKSGRLITPPSRYTEFVGMASANLVASSTKNTVNKPKLVLTQTRSSQEGSDIKPDTTDSHKDEEVVTTIVKNDAVRPLKGKYKELYDILHPDGKPVEDSCNVSSVSKKVSWKKKKKKRKTEELSGDALLVETSDAKKVKFKSSGSDADSVKSESEKIDAKCAVEQNGFCSDLVIESELVKIEAHSPEIKSEDSKEFRQDNSNSNLCSLSCKGAGSQMPTLLCAKCLCLFHPLCVGFEEVTTPVRFICNACKNDLSDREESGSEQEEPVTPSMIVIPQVSLLESAGETSSADATDKTDECMDNSFVYGQPDSVRKALLSDSCSQRTLLFSDSALSSSPSSVHIPTKSSQFSDQGFLHSSGSYPFLSSQEHFRWSFGQNEAQPSASAILSLLSSTSKERSTSSCNSLKVPNVSMISDSHNANSLPFTLLPQTVPSFNAGKTLGPASARISSLASLVSSCTGAKNNFPSMFETQSVPRIVETHSLSQASSESVRSQTSGALVPDQGSNCNFYLINTSEKDGKSFHMGYIPGSKLDSADAKVSCNHDNSSAGNHCKRPSSSSRLEISHKSHTNSQCQKKTSAATAKDLSEQENCLLVADPDSQSNDISGKFADVVCKEEPKSPESQATEDCMPTNIVIENSFSLKDKDSAFSSSMFSKEYLESHSRKSGAFGSNLASKYPFSGANLTLSDLLADCPSAPKLPAESFTKPDSGLNNILSLSGLQFNRSDRNNKINNGKSIKDLLTNNSESTSLLLPDYLTKVSRLSSVGNTSVHGKPFSIQDTAASQKLASAAIKVQQAEGNIASRPQDILLTLPNILNPSKLASVKRSCAKRKRQEPLINIMKFGPPFITENNLPDGQILQASSALVNISEIIKTTLSYEYSASTDNESDSRGSSQGGVPTVVPASSETTSVLVDEVIKSWGKTAKDKSSESDLTISSMVEGLLRCLRNETASQTLKQSRKWGVISAISPSRKLVVLQNSMKNSVPALGGFTKVEVCSVSKGAPLKIPHSSFTSLTAGFDSLNMIFSFLNVADLLRVAQVCRSWHLLTKQPHLWEKVHFKKILVKDWDMGTSILAQHRTETLDLTGLEFSQPDTYEQLSCYIKRISSLKTLILGSGVTPYILHIITDQVSFIQSLEARYITSGVEGNCAAINLQVLGSIPCLKKLTLRGEFGLQLMTDPFFLQLGALQPLNLVHLSLTSLKNTISENFQNLQFFVNLQYLEIGDCNTWDRKNYRNLSYLLNLRYLSLENGGDMVSQAFGKALSKLKNLHTLKLKKWKIGSQLEEGICDLPNLQDLLLWPQIGASTPSFNSNAFKIASSRKGLRHFTWVVDCSETLVIRKLQGHCCNFPKDWKNKVLSLLEDEAVLKELAKSCKVPFDPPIFSHSCSTNTADSSFESTDRCKSGAASEEQGQDAETNESTSPLCSKCHIMLEQLLDLLCCKVSGKIDIKVVFGSWV